MLLALMPGRKYAGNPVVDAVAFEDEGMTGDDRGVVLRFADGEEFQLLIRQTCNTLEG